MKVSIDLPELDGFEYTGEYRVYNPLDWFLASNDKPVLAHSYGDESFHILKKKAPAYRKLYFDDKGYILTTSKEENANSIMVSIKALEDAMHIIKMMNRDTDPRAEGFENYTPLKELLK